MTQEQALAIMKTGANIFLTGEPGSGKTHVVNQYVSYLRSAGIEPAITASTGIAATHIGGLTVHSWSGVGIKTRLNRYEVDKIANTKRIADRIKATKVLIIDEISMLTPDTLDAVEAVCRRAKQTPAAFGGLQVILVGDFFQLPPVMKYQATDPQTSLLTETGGRFAYESSSWQSAKPNVCYLSDQYRQDDQAYLSLLSAIRANKFTAEHLALLRSRRIERTAMPADLPKLYTHNVDVDRVNEEMLAELSGQPRVYKMSARGAKHLVEALQRNCLSPQVLRLKIGAAVMFTKNNPQGKYVNGTLGTVKGYESFNGYPIVDTRDGRRILVEPADWSIEDNGELLAVVTQLPLRLAWAITVHKSQGMSLDGAVMDLSAVFEYGQGYVALSRVRRLSGLHLLGWNERAGLVHPEIIAQDTHFKISSADKLAALQEITPEDLIDRQKNFIKNCGGACGAGVVKKAPTFSALKKTKTDTYNDTLVLWRAGQEPADIAQARHLSVGTILAHLEKLAGQGKIKPAELLKLLSAEARSALPEIYQALVELDTDKLTPVYERFDGQYSYDDLRLAKVILKDKSLRYACPF